MSRKLVNLVYFDLSETEIPDCLVYGRSQKFVRATLRDALERQGLLNHFYNPALGNRPSFKELAKFPTLYVRGESSKLKRLVELAEGYKVNFYTEELGDEFYESKDLFDLSLIFSEKNESDTEFLGSWADAKDFYPYEDSSVIDKIGFFGNKENRTEMLDDLKDIVVHDEADDLNELINKYMFVLAPAGRNFTGMCGRVWEILSCQRLCFCYASETMSKAMKFFEDGKHLVYYRSHDELREKFKYYSENRDEAIKIMKAGHEEVRKNHTADARAVEIVEKIYANI